MPEPLTRSFEVLAIGRLGVDLYPLQTASASKTSDVRQVPRRQRRERGRGRRPPWPTGRADLTGGR